MTTTEIQRIREQLRNALEGGAWHGPALAEAIGDLQAGEALSRPLPALHSPWELVLHVAAWLETVARRLNGEPAELTEAEDWPATGRGGEADWAAVRGRLDRAHAELQRLLEQMGDHELGDRVTGQAYDRYFMLHGVVQHTLYHTGQIVVLKKAIRTTTDRP